MGRIVVGVDGSPGSLAALRFALGQARRSGSVVVAVHAWALPLSEAAPGPFLLELPGPGGRPLDEIVDELARGARARLEAALRQVEAEAEGIEVEARVVEGPSARVLIEASEGADLLVVGSRGHGGFAGLLLGSVSQQCAHHARCPVVIVPSSGRR
jgi:nucleotide-binding universal stress UspA family protein